jgi:hypothetical protein
MTIPAKIYMSRGRIIDLSGPRYYQDMLTGIAEEILYELSELEKMDLSILDEDDFAQVVSITQIRLLNELYYCFGQLVAQGVELEVKQGILDLRDMWNRYIDDTKRPALLKFQVDPQDVKLQ